MARVLDLTPRKKTAPAASSAVMEPISTSLEHDLLLATISVVPAAIMWIGFDHLYLGIALGISIFLAAEYGYPAYKEGRLDLAPVIAGATNIRDMIRSRVLRRA